MRINNYYFTLLKEFYSEIKLEILECHRITHLEDVLIDKLLQPPKEDIEGYEDQY